MLKELKIKLIYSGSEYSLTVFPEHGTFDSLMRDIQKKINISKEIKLMAVNTSAGYQMCTRQTIDSILSEKYSEALMIYVNEIEEGEEDNDLENNIIGNTDDIYDDDLKDDSFEIELKNEKNEKKYHHPVNCITSNEETQNTVDTYDDDIKEITIDKKKEEPNKVTEVSPSSKITNTSIERKIDTELVSAIVNGKEEKANRKSLEEDKGKQPFFQPESFENEVCSLCNFCLKNTKFICCICDNKVLCDACELIHGHPSYKCKTHFLSSINDYYFYARLRQDIKKPPANVEAAKQSYDITIGPKEMEFTMRPNKTLQVPIQITNSSKTDVNPSIFTLLIRNEEKLRIRYDKSKLVVPKSSSITLLLQVDSSSRMCLEEIGLEVYSTTAKLKENKGVTAVMKIEVNEDKEEEELNAVFKENDALKILSKKKKEAVNYIIKEGISVKSPEDIVKILAKADWNTEKALDELTADL